ncbi:MAG TPA: hypothetical protein VHB73_02670, partial [Alphaproteobacteria bacterium]|nr:hypothetical protein [Alphaproteobacteria bacterium]
MAALMAALWPLALAAAEKPAMPKGEWAVGMVPGEKGGFGYCLARAPYDNGLQLALALSPKRELNIGVMVPDGGFKDGDHYPMTVSVDGGFKRERPGVAPQPELLMVPLGKDAEALRALNRGKVLAIEGPEDIAYFGLKGSGKALASLQECVDVGTGKIKPKPASAAPSAAGGKDGKGPGFPPGLLGMLKAAGLKKLEVLPVPDPEKSPVDFAWRTDGVLGGLRERPVPEDMTLEKMSSLIEDGYKTQCKGGLFHISFTDPEELPGVRLRKADISCQSGGQYAHVALLLYITDTHLFSLFMHEVDGGHKEKADHA